MLCPSGNLEICLLHSSPSGEWRSEIFSAFTCTGKDLLPNCDVRSHKDTWLMW